MTFASRLRNFWFHESFAEDLGWARLVFFAGTFCLYFDRNLEQWSNQLAQSNWQPIPLFSFFHVHPVSVTALTVLEWIWKLSLFTSAIGLLTRLSTSIAALLGLYLLGLQHSFGYVPHTHNLTVFCLVILSLSSCGDGLSVDQWFRLRNGRALNGIGYQYAWPIKLVWTAWCLLFFAAGIAKLRRSGLAWALSDNLANLFLRNRCMYAEYVSGSPFPSLGLWLARFPQLCMGLAVIALSCELLAPMALFHRKARILLVTVLGAMQIMIYFTMHMAFVWCLPAYLVWLPWRRMVHFLRKEMLA